MQGHETPGLLSFQSAGEGPSSICPRAARVLQQRSECSVETPMSYETQPLYGGKPSVPVPLEACAADVEVPAVRDAEGNDRNQQG